MAKKNKEPDVRQPDQEQQKEYASLRDNSATVVHIRKKAYKLRWAKNGQIRKLSQILLLSPGTEEGSSSEDLLKDIAESSKLCCKAAAIYILDGYWKLKFKYWFLWRWFYYIRQYDDEDLKEVLETGKKSTATAVLRDYHVTDRGKGYTDDDEDEGSRTYPSRTQYGAAFASAEKRQWLVAPRYFLFGLARVPMWEYMWGHTKAQIELMTADAPFVAYKAREKKKPGDPGFKSDPEKIQRDYERWLERKRARKVNLDTFLGGKGGDNIKDNDRDGKQ